MQRFNLAQRIVVIAALGVMAWLAGAYLTAPVPFRGWVAYAPLSNAGGLVPANLADARDGLAPLANLLVAFGLVLAWAAASFVLLGHPRRRRREPGRQG